MVKSIDIATYSDDQLLELGIFLKPGRLSDRGFLGEDEDLLKVLARDTQTLEELGLSRYDFAKLLTKLRYRLLNEENERYFMPEQEVVFPLGVDSGYRLQTEKVSVDTPWKWESLYKVLDKNGKVVYEIREDDMFSQSTTGYDFYGMRVDQVIVRQEMFWGGQECPFCRVEGFEYVSGGSDFEVRNIETREKFEFSDMHLHLIEEHGFFEGDGGYRLDPITTLRVLGVLNELHT